MLEGRSYLLVLSRHLLKRRPHLLLLSLGTNLRLSGSHKFTSAGILEVWQKGSIVVVLNCNQTLVDRMTQSNDANDFNPEITRNLKSLSRRVDRLEYSQISPQEFSRAFDRVYDEIDALEGIVNQRFDRLEGEIKELNRKFDIVMQHITGQSGTV